jgi:hypothetical protein
MTRYYGNQRVEPGIYFCAKELSFKSMDEDGRLPGGPERAYWRVPALALLVAAPMIGLAYVIFLPLVGFVMLGAVALQKVGSLVREMGVWAATLLRPAWQPARAFLSRGKARKEKVKKGEEPKDRWAEEVREELEKDEDELS